MKTKPKPRAGKYGSGMLDQAATAVNKRKASTKSRLDSVMGDIQQNRGTRRRNTQNGSK